MLKKIIYIIILLIISTSIYSQVTEGYIDLSNYDFVNLEPVNLSGYWSLKFDGEESKYSMVPGGWGVRYGRATYSIIIESRGQKDLIFAPSQINTYFKIFLNGQLLVNSRQNRPVLVPVDLINGKNQIQIQIENYTDMNPGIRSKPFIGSYIKVMDKHERSILQDTITSGASFVIFIFFIALFLYYKKDRSTLYFALICLFLFIRGYVTNDKVIYYYYPEIPYLLVNKLEYLSIYILPPLLLLFNRSYFKAKWNIISTTLFYLSLFLPTITLFTFPRVYISLIYIFYIFAMVVSLYLIISLLYYVKKRLEDALKILLSVITLLVASLFDIYIAFNNISVSMILSRVMIVFTLFMSFIVSHKQIRNILRIHRLSKSNREVNKYLHKFIPKDFIRHIGKNDITAIELGDGAEKNMTVLFASLKGFYKQTRLLKGEEVITLLNRYLSLVSPVILRHGGFVDKFMDETIMALFPGRPEDAIDAALEISKVLNEHNLKNRDAFSLRVQSGIHIGSLYMGIVGDESRFDATVISKAVNSASRIATFTQKIDKEILVSEDIFNSLGSDSDYTTNYMGRVKLKGNNESIGIYSIKTDLEKKGTFRLTESDNLFSITMKKLENSTLDKIEDVLWKIKGINPEHTPTLYYLKLIKENRRLEDLDK